MNDNLILVKTFSSPIDANISLGFLQANGIEGILFDENTIYANPLYATAIGGVKLLVRESDYEAALEIFNEIRNDSENEKEKLECPKCSSKEVVLKYKQNWTALLIMLLSFSFTPNTGNTIKYKCKKCKFTWEDELKVNNQ
jgi:DNA-directed RNA polymerase subunit M/transcription elongation factor TFIIS